MQRVDLLESRAGATLRRAVMRFGNRGRLKRPAEIERNHREHPPGTVRVIGRLCQLNRNGTDLKSKRLFV